MLLEDENCYFLMTTKFLFSNFLKEQFQLIYFIITNRYITMQPIGLTQRGMRPKPPLPTFISKQKPRLVIKEDLDMSSDQISLLADKHYVIMSEKEYDYLNQNIRQRSRLCCQRYLVKGKLPFQPFSSKYHFESFSNLVFQREKQMIIRKLIVGFLNAEGGYLFIGIQETPGEQKYVVGMELYECEMEAFAHQIRSLLDKVEPNILQQRKVHTSFIPVKQSATEDSYLPGRFVIKVTIQQGDPNFLYQIKTGSLCSSYLKNQNLRIQPSKQQIDRQISLRKWRPQCFMKVHKCPQPDLGHRIYRVINKKIKAYQGNNNECAITFLLQNYYNIAKLENRIKDVPYHLFRLDKVNNSNFMRLELFEEVKDIQGIIEFYGGRIIEISNHSAKQGFKQEIKQDIKQQRKKQLKQICLCEKQNNIKKQKENDVKNDIQPAKNKKKKSKKNKNQNNILTFKQQEKPKQQILAKQVAQQQKQKQKQKRKQRRQKQKQKRKQKEDKTKIAPLPQPEATKKKKNKKKKKKNKGNKSNDSDLNKETTEEIFSKARDALFGTQQGEKNKNKKN